MIPLPKARFSVTPSPHGGAPLSKEMVHLGISEAFR